MGWNKKLICIILVFIFTTLIPVSIFADSPSSAALPPLDKLFDGKNSNQYIEYRENYFLDSVDAGMFDFGNQINNAINSLANVCFLLQVQIGYMLVATFYYAFEIDIYGMLSGVVKVFTDEMKGSVFDELSLIAILFLGIFFIVKVVQNQKTQVWIAILQTVLIIAISMYFFSNPMQALKQVDSGTKELSRSILSGTYKATNGGSSPNSAVMAAANNIWYVFVHQPWQMLEFGNMEMAKSEEKNILSLPAGGEQRKEYIKKLAEDGKHFTPDWGLKRLGLLLLYFIPITIIFGVILIMCLLMLAYQVLTIIFTLFGVFVFILALIPFFGTRLLQNWASKIISFASIKVVVCFCIGVMLAFISSIFKVSDQYGWLITMLLEVVVVVTVIWKKDALFELFTFIRLAPQNPSMANKQLRKDSNVESRINDYMGTRMSGFRNKKTGNSEEKSNGKLSDNNDTKGTSDNTKDEKPKKPKKQKEKQKSNSDGTGTKEVGQPYSSSSNGNTFTPEASYSGILNEMNDDQAEDSNNFRQLMKKAEEILQKQYEISKMEAENKADKLQKEPEYSSFVRKADTREALGAPKFEQREIIAVANNLQKIVDAGGSPEELLSRNETGKSPEAESRPKDVIGLVVNGQQQSIDRGEAYKIIVQDAAKDYTNEFNQEYNKKYDDKFFEDLIKRYGQQNVRQILSRMKEVKEKEGNIKNPAGYLTQSLKNAGMENGGSMRSKGADKID